MKPQKPKKPLSLQMPAAAPANRPAAVKIEVSEEAKQLFNQRLETVMRDSLKVVAYFGIQNVAAEFVSLIAQTQEEFTKLKPVADSLGTVFDKRENGVIIKLSKPIPVEKEEILFVRVEQPSRDPSKRGILGNCSYTTEDWHELADSVDRRPGANVIEGDGEEDHNIIELKGTETLKATASIPNFGLLEE